MDTETERPVATRAAAKKHDRENRERELLSDAWIPPRGQGESLLYVAVSIWENHGYG
jgi:hypothetical protein